MVAVWMLYAAVVAALLALAAAALDRAARAARRPARGVWAAALAASLVVPAAALVPRAEHAAVAVPESTAADPAAAGRALAWLVLLVGAPAGVAATPAARWEALDRPLALAWGASAAAGLAWLLLSHRALRRRRRSWPTTTVAGAEVLVSRDVGPAVVGVGDARVVLPAWALALDAERLRLMLAHEREHVRARDPLLLTVAVVAAALVPWNPAVWWQLRRLRLAVEVDCDRRVLRRHPDVRAYGGLLLDVARRADLAPTLPAAFASLSAGLTSSTSSLERRIRTMTVRPSPRSATQAVALVAVAAGLVAAACETPRPTAPRPQGRPALSRITSAAPEMAGAAEVSEATVRAAIARHLPEVARSATGRAQHVWLVADAEGRVVQSLHGVAPGRDGAGVPVIDPASIKSVNVFKLAPGRLAPDSVAAIWVALRAPGDTAGGAVGASRLRVAAPGGQGATGADVADGARATVRIRSAQGQAVPGDPGRPAPLYIVDGRELSNEDAHRMMDSLAPSGIESIEVLKNEAAERIFGTRARGGVVRITTKAAAAARATVREM